MPGRILQINFKFSVSRAEYDQAASSLAGDYATLVWR